MKIEGISFIQQEDSCCIPASLFCLLEFIQHKTDLSQLDLLTKIAQVSAQRSISYYLSVVIVFEKIGLNSSITTYVNDSFSNYTEWFNNISRLLDNGIPVVFSTRWTSDETHSRVIYGINEDEKLFYIMNPNDEEETEYSFDRALKDFNLDNPCRDQLWITKV